MNEAETDRWVLEGVEAARTLLDGSGRETWRPSKLPGTGGGMGASVVVRLKSASRTVVSKLVRRNDLAADHALWWLRELEVYQSTWLRGHMPRGLRLPECLGSATTEDACVILLSDVPFDDHSARTIDWYRDLAVELGRMNGTPMSEVPPWATRGFVAHETSDAVPLIPAALADPSPWVADVLEPWRAILERVASDGEALAASLDAFPEGLHHLDAFSRNAASVGVGEPYFLIDWAYAGVAPVGCDAAALISITAMHGDVPEGRTTEFHEAVMEGYTSGLAAVGSSLTPDEVRRAVDIALTLRWVRFLTQLNAAGDALPAFIMELNGVTVGDMATEWIGFTRHLTPAAERSLADLGRS